MLLNKNHEPRVIFTTLQALLPARAISRLWMVQTKNKIQNSRAETKANNVSSMFTSRKEEILLSPCFNWLQFRIFQASPNDIIKYPVIKDPRTKLETRIVGLNFIVSQLYFMKGKMEVSHIIVFPSFFSVQIAEIGCEWMSNHSFSVIKKKLAKDRA